MDRLWTLGCKMRWKTAILLLVGLAIGIGLGLLVLRNTRGTNEGTSTVRRKPLTAGSVAPDFSLNRLDGEALSLSQFKGKPVVINFWASWCVPCKEEMPLLEKNAQTYKDQVAFLGINVQESDATAAQFVKETGITFPVVLDINAKTADLYFVRGYPTTFFIDAAGDIRTVSVGPLNELTLGENLSKLGIEP